MRPFWFVFGLLSCALGMIGIVLPLLPTVPFMILAAFCFGKSSPTLHAWLIEHPIYGPHIRDWRQKGAIHPNAKRIATISLAASFGISLVVRVRPEILLIQAAVLLAVLAFIWSRPSD